MSSKGKQKPKAETTKEPQKTERTRGKEGSEVGKATSHAERPAEKRKSSKERSARKQSPSKEQVNERWSKTHGNLVVTNAWELGEQRIDSDMFHRIITKTSKMSGGQTSTEGVLYSIKPYLASKYLATYPPASLTRDALFECDFFRHTILSWDASSDINSDPSCVVKVMVSAEMGHVFCATVERKDAVPGTRASVSQIIKEISRIHKKGIVLGNCELDNFRVLSSTRTRAYVKSFANASCLAIPLVDEAFLYDAAKKDWLNLARSVMLRAGVASEFLASQTSMKRFVESVPRGFDECATDVGMILDTLADDELPQKPETSKSLTSRVTRDIKGIYHRVLSIWPALVSATWRRGSCMACDALFMSAVVLERAIRSIYSVTYGVTENDGEDGALIDAYVAWATILFPRYMDNQKLLDALPHRITSAQLAERVLRSVEQMMRDNAIARPTPGCYLARATEYKESSYRERTLAILAATGIIVIPIPFDTASEASDWCYENIQMSETGFEDEPQVAFAINLYAAGAAEASYAYGDDTLPAK